MKKQKKLPKQVYVYWDGDGEGYLNVQLTPRGIDDGTQVGIYQLTDTKEQKITEELV